MKFKLVEAAESKICCICKKPFDGYGNNAEPVCSGSCCDECNMKEVIPARIKMLDKSSSEDIDEAVLTEALEDYKITYYLSTATAERRPETIEDVENDWKEEVFAADSDYDALLYALELIDNEYDDTDFSTAEEIVKYFEEKDLGDGSAFVVKLEGPNGAIYDMGQTKEDFIEQVKENDEMLAYYRKVLGIDESLNESIDPSKALEIKKTSDADVIFYGYQYKNEEPVEIAPEELSSEEYQNRKNRIVSDYNKLYADKPQANRYAKEHDFIFYALYNRKNEELNEGRFDPYFTPYGYRAAAKVLNRTAPEYYWHLKEIEMDKGDGIKLANYALKKGLPVMLDKNSDLDYPEFYLKDGSSEYHWGDYFYTYGFINPDATDLVPYEGNLDILNTEKDDNKMNEILSEEVHEVPDYVYCKTYESLPMHSKAKVNNFINDHIEEIDTNRLQAVIEDAIYPTLQHYELEALIDFLTAYGFEEVIDVKLPESLIVKLLSRPGMKDSFKVLINKLPAVKNMLNDPKFKEFAERKGLNNKINEDMSVRAKLKALYPELNFGDKVEEAINEGNSVSGKIPPALDSFLQDIAQMYATIDYGDIMDHDYTEDDIRKLNNLRRRFITWAQYDEDDEEVKAKFNEIANKVAEILKRVKDDNKMNEVFGDIVNYESAEDWIKRIESQEGQISIFDDEDKDTFEKFAKDVYFYAKNNGFKHVYVEDDCIQFKKTSTIPEGELATSIDIFGNNHEVYVNADLREGKWGRILGEIFILVHDMNDVKTALDDIKAKVVKKAEDNKKAEEEKLKNTPSDQVDNNLEEIDISPWDIAQSKFGQYDDDTDFDIDESAEYNLMEALYKGNNIFEDYDDEDLEESSDCEDDECWENDFISEEFDDAFDEDLSEDFNTIPESDEEHGKYIWKISFDTTSGEYEATNDVDDIYAHGATLKDCIEDLKALVNEQAEIDGSVVVKKFSDKHVDYSESDLDNLGYVIVKYGRFRFW